jgi:hypothetical protein
MVRSLFWLRALLMYYIAQFRSVQFEKQRLEILFLSLHKVAADSYLSEPSSKNAPFTTPDFLVDLCCSFSSYSPMGFAPKKGREPSSKGFISCLFHRTFLTFIHPVIHLANF